MERTSKSESQVEALDCLDEEIQVWNGEEDEWHLSKRAEALCEDRK
jgi:hypothetical protein